MLLLCFMEKEERLKINNFLPFNISWEIGDTFVWWQTKEKVFLLHFFYYFQLRNSLLTKWWHQLWPLLRWSWWWNSYWWLYPAEQFHPNGNLLRDSQLCIINFNVVLSNYLSFPCPIYLYLKYICLSRPDVDKNISKL